MRRKRIHGHRRVNRSPIKHGMNSTKTGPHTKFKTETEHEEYHDIHPTEDLNKAEMEEASKPKNTIKIKQPKK